MAGGRLGGEGHGTSVGCTVRCLCLFLPLNPFDAPDNRAVTLLGVVTALPSVIWAGLTHRSPFPWLSGQLQACVSNSSIALSQLDTSILSTQRKKKDKD